MAGKRGVGSELLFVRHDNDRMRSEVSQVGKWICRPFENCGSTRFDSSDQSTFLLPQPISHRRTMLVGRFPKQQWFSVWSRSAAIDKILAANVGAGRLQFARLQFDCSGKLVTLEVLRKGKILGRWQVGPGSTECTVSGGSNLKRVVGNIHEAKGALKSFREFYELGTSLKSLVETDDFYQVIDERGREMAPQACALLVLEGPKQAPKSDSPIAAPARAPTAGESKQRTGKNARKVNLPAALTRLDAAQVRLALEQGASPTTMSGSKVSPLLYAIQRLESPGARECAQALVAAGAEIGHLIAECCTNLYSPQQSFDRVHFLIELGGDVNAPSESGASAIYSATRHANLAVVKLLLKHGADPHAVIPRHNATTIEWAQDQLARSTVADRRQAYADILTELTGSQVDVPRAEPLSDAQRAENQRFLQALRAMQLLTSLPQEYVLQDADENKLQSHSEFQRLQGELQDEGFRPNGLRFERTVVPVFITCYTNERRCMDAVVSDRWWSKEVGCRIFSYGDDGRLYSLSNVGNPADADFDPEFLIRGECLRCRPKRLVAELAKLVRQSRANLLATPQDEFAARYQSGNDRILSETKRRINESLERDAICDDTGRPLRFERRRIYLDFSGFSDPEFSSRHLAEHTWKDVTSTRVSEEAHQLAVVIRCCFTLLAMQYLQYAGAPRDRSFLETGCEAGIELFEKLKTVWKKELALGHMEELGMAMLLCRLNGDDARLRKLCDLVQPRMMTAALRADHDPPLALGQALLAIVSQFRTKPVPQLAEIKKQVQRSRSQRAKAVVRICDGLERNDGPSIANSLAESIRLFAAEADPNPNPNHLISKFAVPESILFDSARDASLPLEIPVEIADWMIAN